MKTKPVMRMKLAMAILRDGRNQYEIAQAAGIDAPRLTRIKKGMDHPTDAQADALADVLGCARKGLGL